jgi:putative SOS response-associated peptidase YedK
MCGRFANALKPSAAWLELMQEWPEQLFNRYNVSPSSQIGAFVDGACFAMRWGLVPSWSTDISSRYATFNARIETIESKPAFRNAWRKNQKCLIPALGYYEWRIEQGEKQPYFVTSHDQQMLVFAGLWDDCSIGDAQLKSCSIITAESRVELKQIHERMPLVINLDTARQWLESGAEKSLLLDKCVTDLNIYKVSKRVNNAREEDEELIQAV